MLFFYRAFFLTKWQQSIRLFSQNGSNPIFLTKWQQSDFSPKMAAMRSFFRLLSAISVRL
jgi:hypothetical protein